MEFIGGRFRMSVYTPWKKKRKEIPKISGEEEVLKESWERYEEMAFLWIWSWVMR
jgi:hypothetical protein